jgi:hypothetical protein
VHPQGADSKSPHFLEDFVGSLGPLKRLPVLVVHGDVLEDRLPKLGNAGVRSTPERLRKKAEGFRIEVEGWTTAPPAAEDLDRFMKLVLKLHVDVANVERKRGRSEALRRHLSGVRRSL